MTKGNDTAHPANAQTQTEGGLTKREYFAAMAMQGMIARGTRGAKGIAETSVEAADALINALNTPHP